MSYATLESLNRAKSRRFDVAEVEGVGLVRMRSLLPSEYIRVEGLKSRGLLAFKEGDYSTGNQCIAEADDLTVRLVWVDGDGQPTIADDAKSPFAAVDFAVFARLLAACNAHLATPSFSLEDAAKNSDPTPGG